MSGFQPASFFRAIKPGGGGEGGPPPPTQLSFTAGEAISENDAVFLDLSDGEIYKATVDLIDNTHFFLGIAAASAAENASVAVYTQGQIDFTVDGAVGEDLYLTSDPGVVATNPTFPYAVVVGRSQTLM